MDIKEYSEVAMLYKDNKDNKDNNIKDLSFYDYDLPDNLIAHYPSDNRVDSRLMLVNKGINSDIKFDKKFKDLIDFIEKDDLIVLNETKVLPARLFGVKPTGGRVEVLVERLETDSSFLAQVKSSKSLKSGQKIYICSDNFSDPVNFDELNLCAFFFKVIDRCDMFYRIKLERVNNKDNNKINLQYIFDNYGHMPLPPYIKRNIKDKLKVMDKSRYQTVYAKNLGSAAAPTAGLHFDDKLISALKYKGVNFSKVTLHVGAGTFSPVRCDDITKHKMHSEWINCPQHVCDLIKKTKEKGGRVIAVGTTSMRVLESVAKLCNYDSELKPYSGMTDIFIYPGFKFKVVDALITNFHLPKSSLMMLVSAFAGCDVIKDAYKIAISRKFRFFSYGDAMFIL